ncbi:MAG: protein kinase [Bradymonadales bacterium]|nr:protein kinase [Bradymonadales bacterium]
MSKESSRTPLVPTTLREDDTLVSGQQTMADLFREEFDHEEQDEKSFTDLEDLTLVAVLGRGGMGVVYRALQRSLQREVAVKLLHPRLSQRNDQFEQFYREVLLAASLNHPNIAHIHWVKRKERLFYYVMEYVQGFTLAELLGRRSLSLEEVIGIFSQVCDGLAYAHLRGIVHRDLKPGNILVEWNESDSPGGTDPNRQNAGKPGPSRAVLVDFGLAARPGEASLTREGTLMGTPAYMSPEQVRGEPTDHRSDIYSLGVTLFEALTGRVPFGAPNPLAMAVKHLSDAPPDPRRIVPGLPETLAQLCLEMLAKSPDERPQSCDLVKQKLLSALGADTQRPAATTAISGPSGLQLREVTVLAADLEGFLASANDQAVARTSFLLEQWVELFDQAVATHMGLTVRREAALMVAVFNYPAASSAHRTLAIKALKEISRLMREFNQTHGRALTFTAGLECGRLFAGSVGELPQPICFGRAMDTAIRLCRVQHCGLGLLGPAASQALVAALPLEPLIGVAEDLGSATRIAPGYFET